jgi:hypothetical protein
VEYSLPEGTPTTAAEEDDGNRMRLVGVEEGVPGQSGAPRVAQWLVNIDAIPKDLRDSAKGSPFCLVVPVPESVPEQDM